MFSKMIFIHGILFMLLISESYQQSRFCADGRFRCPFYETCLDIWEVCDRKGINHCPNGEDESWEYARCGNPPTLTECEANKDLSRATLLGINCRKKSCTDDTDCKGGLKTCNCDGFCGTSCFNKEGICDEPPPIVAHSTGHKVHRFKGNFLYPVYRAIADNDQAIYGDIVIYQCPNNMVVKSDGDVICGSKRKWSTPSVACVYVDECIPGTQTTCDINAKCTNLTGGYKCICNEGYVGDGYSCQDLDECSTRTHNCDLNARCTNTIGSYTCNCKVGFTLHYTGDGFNCRDIDECIEEGQICDANAKCTNTMGSFTCSCNEGYSGNGFKCQDVDECSPGRQTCDINAKCTNTIGSFTCTCNGGYVGNGLKCKDPNECTGENNCHVNAKCTNTTSEFPSSGYRNYYRSSRLRNPLSWLYRDYTCKCKPGFKGLGYSTEYVKKYKKSQAYSCQDIDECNTEEHKCHRKAKCTNTMGSFTCSCNEGYSGNGFQCQDLYKCKGPNNCDVNAACTNTTRGGTVNSYTCECNIGFSGDGYTCQDIDECSTGEHKCLKKAKCINTIGSYTCKCSEGYALSTDGVCSDMNECSTGEHNCDANAWCDNEIGGYTCNCNPGYAGPGYYCRDQGWAYRYEISPTAGYSWDTARAYCARRGGQLAYHDLDTIEKRFERICNTAEKWCDKLNINLWWGLRRVGVQWKYLDGTNADDRNILWAYENEKTAASGQDCSYLHSYEVNDTNGLHQRLKAKSDQCNSIHEKRYNLHKKRYAFCEFKV